MSGPRIPSDPARFVVGVATAATLSTVLVGLISLPGLDWALARGDTPARVATAVVVGYGVVLAWQLRQSDAEETEFCHEDTALTGLQMVRQSLLATALYSGTVAAAAVGLPALGSSLGLSPDTVVFLGLFYPWWERLTTTEVVSVPLPFSFTGGAVYVLTLTEFVSVVAITLVSSDSTDWKRSNVSRWSQGVATVRRWPTVFVDRDALFGRSSPR